MALYDPNEFPTETVTSPDFTLADVLAWARTKPADEEYEYADNRNCALCQFLAETGRAADPHVDSNGWSDGPPLSQIGYDKRIDRAANYWRGETFGAFADRLEKALS